MFSTYRYACIGIETLQRDPPPRSASGFELASLADKDSHAETAEEAGGGGGGGAGGGAGGGGQCGACPCAGPC